MIEIRHNIPAVKRWLSDVERRQIPFATAQALNRTAKVIQRELEQEVGKVFDKPVPFTRRAFGVQFANKASLKASIFVRPAQAAYLLPQIEGGRRPRKRFEERLRGETRGEQTGFYAPGAGARLNASGNLTRGQIVTIANKLKAKGQNVFAGAVRGRFGIWERAKRGGVKPLLVEIPQPSYRKRLPFYEIGRRVAAREFPQQFAAAFQAARRTAR